MKDLAQFKTPGPQGSMDLMSAFTCQPKENLFFSDGMYVSDQDWKVSAVKRMPGHGYYMKVLGLL